MMNRTKEDTLEAVYRYAKFLRDNGWRTTYAAVGDWLKHSGFKRVTGDPFDGSPRGAAQVIADAYDYAAGKYGPDQAQIIFYAFCNSEGLHNSRGEHDQYTKEGDPA